MISGCVKLEGKTAKFSVKVLNVRDATEHEIRNGIANENVPMH